MNGQETKNEFVEKVKEFYDKHRRLITIGLGVADALLICRYFYLRGWNNGWNKGFVDGEHLTNGIIGTILWNNDKELFNATNDLITKENVKKALEIASKN